MGEQGRYVNCEDENHTRAMAATESTAGRAHLAMAAGDRDAYDAAWEPNQQAVRDSTWSATAWPDMPLGEVLPVRLANLLSSNWNALYVRDLRGLTFDKFISFPNANSKSWKQVYDTLAERRDRHEQLRREHHQPDKEDR